MKVKIIFIVLVALMLTGCFHMVEMDEVQFRAATQVCKEKNLTLWKISRNFFGDSFAYCSDLKSYRM